MQGWTVLMAVQSLLELCMVIACTANGCSAPVAKEDPLMLQAPVARPAPALPDAQARLLLSFAGGDTESVLAQVGRWCRSHSHPC